MPLPFLFVLTTAKLKFRPCTYKYGFRKCYSTLRMLNYNCVNGRRVGLALTQRRASTRNFSRKQCRWVSMLAAYGLPIRIFVAPKECG